MSSPPPLPARRCSSLWPLLCLFLLLCAAPMPAAVVSDDFNDSLPNGALWAFPSVGTGPSIEEREGRLEVTVPSTSAGSTFIVAAEMRSRFRDTLDVQVDFDLLEYPPRNGIRVGIVIQQAGDVFASV
jgi:hypothetical protein